MTGPFWRLSLIAIFFKNVTYVISLTRDLDERMAMEDIEKRYPEYVKVLPDGHPVKVYFDENFHLQGILREINETDSQNDFEKFFNLFNQLCEVEKRYARKENQLFPYLEKYGWTGPSQGMWSFHDSNRDLLRIVRKKIEDKNLEGIGETIRIIIGEMQRLAMVEEMRLFPYALELLTEEDWQEMKAGDEEIGWMMKHTPTNDGQINSNIATSRGPYKTIMGALDLDQGYLNQEQINLLLKFMPVDLTYVDENDRVLFYNRGEDRIFPRSAGIIGREVRFCHPPKSVDTVLRILEEFKKGTKSEAEFWIRFKGKVVHIRYFALRNKEGVYKGVIEMSQDITAIQKLEGEQRLLSWDN